MMNKKEYKNPTTQVVGLQHTGMLMTSGSGMDATRSGYGTASTGDNTEQTWD